MKPSEQACESPNIDSISKELYEYIVSKTCGTEVATSSCLCELYKLKWEYVNSNIGWILTNGEIKISNDDLFKIDDRLRELMTSSGKYFIDSSQYDGAPVGLPFNVGGILSIKEDV